MEKDFTDKNNSITLECNSLFFHKLIIRKGQIDDLFVKMEWKTKEKVDNAKNVAEEKFHQFFPSQYTCSVKSDIFEFNLPHPKITLFGFRGNIDGVSVKVFSRTENEFDITFVIDLDPVVNEE